jgi:hypothetical protein
MNNRDDLLQGDSSSQDALQALAEERLEEKRDLSENRLEEVAGGMDPLVDPIIKRYSERDGIAHIVTERRGPNTTVVHHVRAEDLATPHYKDHPLVLSPNSVWRHDGKGNYTYAGGAG